jgi:hypothetical protein
LIADGFGFHAKFDGYLFICNFRVLTQQFKYFALLWRILEKLVQVFPCKGFGEFRQLSALFHQIFVAIPLTSFFESCLELSHPVRPSSRREISPPKALKMTFA